MKKKVLMLGGSLFQVPAIEKAKALGLTVYTCGNIPTDPGHALADAYHPVSTTDLEGVLALARELMVDGVSAYASDPAAVTAAYVSEQLGLPGDPYRATCTIQDKVDLRAVQAELGLPAPEALLCRGPEDILRTVVRWEHGGIIKPVDASGSKGVHTVPPGIGKEEAGRVFEDALANSRSKRVVLEEFLRREGPQMTGDAVVHQGRIKAWCFGDVHFDPRVNGLVPCGVTLPGSMEEPLVEKAMADVQRLIDHLGLRQGVYNIDIFKDERGRPIVVDIGTRPGGNMLTTLYQCRTGLDMMELAVRMSVGDEDLDIRPVPTRRCVSHLVIHSHRSGILEGITLSDRIRPYVFYKAITVPDGAAVEPFTAASKRVGLLLLEFPDVKEMHDIYAHQDEHVRVALREPRTP